jgi:hypothetical protein
MNKKRSASSKASPRSYRTRSQKRCLVGELFASVVRNNVALGALVYSFLPVQDRVRLGQVDKQFYADEHRGQIVGIYGDDDCLDTEAALERVREYMEFEGTPDSLTVDLGTPHCWDWVWGGIDDPSWLADKLQDNWFDEKSGYDLKAIQEHADFGEYQEKVMERLDYVIGIV